MTVLYVFSFILIGKLIDCCLPLRTPAAAGATAYPQKTTLPAMDAVSAIRNLRCLKTAIAADSLKHGGRRGPQR